MRPGVHGKKYGERMAGVDLNELLQQRGGERFALHERLLNGQLVRVLRTIGFDRHYVSAQGPYLFDGDGNRYLDLLSGFGVFGIGRNHPAVKRAIMETLEADLPNLVQMDVSVLSGLLAEKLAALLPGLDKYFFCSSGAEAVEAAIKFARFATRRARIIHCEHAFHGLTYGALSLNGGAEFRDGFGPLLPDCVAVPFNDLAALESALSSREAAAFVVEPIQGKGVNLPRDDYLRAAAALCRKYGTLFVADEIQTGMGRTGRFAAIEHWDVEADMVLLAKGLSGGFVPVGAVAMKKWIFDRLFDRMDRAVMHGSTFSKTDLAMAAGLATLAVMEDEHLVARAGAQGAAHHGRSRRASGQASADQGSARQGHDDRHRVRRARQLQAPRRLVVAGPTGERTLLPDGDHAAVHPAPHPDPGCRTRAAGDQAVAVLYGLG